MQEGGKAATSYQYYEPSGLMQSMSGPGASSSATASFTYDSLGNVLTTTTSGNNAATSLTTSFSYDVDGTYTQSPMVGRPIAAMNSLGKVSHFRYDVRGNLVWLSDTLGSIVECTYNLADQAVSTIYPATGQTGPGQSATTSVYLFSGGPVERTRHWDESGLIAREVTYQYGPEGELLVRGGSSEPVSYQSQ